MIVVFGSLNMDLVTQVQTIPGPGRTVLAPSYATHFGGKGANQAVAAARMAGAGRVRMAGCVGADAFGDDAVENLLANGVDAGLIVRSDAPTGCAFITVDAHGENAITVASGANSFASATSLPADAFDAGTTLVLQMEVPWQHSLNAARKARAAGGRVIWNLAPVPETGMAESVRNALSATDYLIVNEHEAKDAAAAIGLDAPEWTAAAAALAKAGDLTCVVTAGAEGAFAYAPDGSSVHASASRIVPVDTTGAGDTFVGAFACLIDERAPIEEALAIGCKAAALKCLKAGAQPGMPTRSEIGLS